MLLVKFKMLKVEMVFFLIKFDKLKIILL